MTTANPLVRATVGGAPSGAATLPPQPVIPANPVETGLPAQSASISNTGPLLDYLPVPWTCVSSHCKPTINSIKSPVVGIISPQGNQHSSGTFSADWNQLLFTYMIDPSSSAAAGSVLQETDYWQLIYQDIVAANQPFSLQQAITSGVSQSDTTSFAYTLGIKIGGSYQGITGELSASLTKTFSHTVTVSQQQTVTQNFTAIAQPYTQIVGIYQLMQTFEVIPGANLTQYIAGLSKTIGSESSFCKMMGMCMSVGVSAKAVNQTPTYLQIVAYDQPSAAAAARVSILSMSDAAALAQSSVEMTTA